MSLLRKLGLLWKLSLLYYLSLFNVTAAEIGLTVEIEPAVLLEGIFA